MLSEKDQLFLDLIGKGELSIDKQGRIWRHIKSVGGLSRKKIRLTKPVLAEYDMPNGYKQIQVFENGKRFTYSAHRLVWLYHYGCIPDGYMIHHINGIVIDNRKENLMSMPYKKHNEIHDLSGYPAWQNGVSSKKREEWHRKTVNSKHKNYLERAKTTYHLRYEMGMTAKEIAHKLGITDRTVYKHLDDYRKEVMPIATPDHYQRETVNNR